MTCGLPVFYIIVRTMPAYEYIGLSREGKPIKGSIDADNQRAARQRLRTQGLFATELKEVAETSTQGSRDVRSYFTSNKISLKQLSVSTRQLATLVTAGLPLVSALQALADQSDATALKRIIVDVREQVEQGSALAQALAKFPKSFPRLYINMVASGEASGTLDTVLLNLAEYLESQVELRRKVWSALTYPALMLSICLLVISALLIFVIPRIVEIFEKQGATLPLPTRFVIGLSHFLVFYWYVVLLAVVGGVALLRWYYRQPPGRARCDMLLLRLPGFKHLYIKVATARIARTLSALLASGVGLLAGLEIVRNIVANVHLSKALDEAKDGVREGKSLARELNRSGLFPSMLSHMVAVGEKSGELEQMLERAGKAYESEVNASLNALTSLLEPIMMIIVGAVVLLIVVSVLLPMADLISVIQK